MEVLGQVTWVGSDIYILNSRAILLKMPVLRNNFLKFPIHSGLLFLKI